MQQWQTQSIPEKVDEKGIHPFASRMLSERSTTELHTRMISGNFGLPEYGIFKVELKTPSINECQPCLDSIVVVRLIRNQNVVGSIPTRGFFFAVKTRRQRDTEAQNAR